MIPKPDDPPAADDRHDEVVPLADLPKVPEVGGRKNGLDPTRYGDWEKNGRCIDF